MEIIYLRTILLWTTRKLMCLAIVMKNMHLCPRRRKGNLGEVKVGMQDGGSKGPSNRRIRQQRHKKRQGKSENLGSSSTPSGVAQDDRSYDDPDKDNVLPQFSPSRRPGLHFPDIVLRGKMTKHLIFSAFSSHWI